MGITSSLVTALSGLSSSQTQIDVVGNNIANVNTVGYKSSTLDFKTQFLENFSYGSAPNGNLGGTNPVQIGLGTTTGAVTTDYGDGSLQATGVPTDLAIQGNGFFVLKQGAQQVYTRDGTFQLNDQDQLVSSAGALVQGYGVDSNFNILPGNPTTITIPLGTAAVAQATTNSAFTGSLNSNGTLPSSAAVLSMAPMYLSNGAGGVSATPPAATDLMTNLTDASGTSLFQVGDVITLNAQKGTSSSNGTNYGSGVRSIVPHTFTVAAASTLSDFESFVTGALGINTGAGAQGPLASTPGVTIPTDATNTNAVDLTITGNPGYDNNITLNNNSISIDRAGTITTPFTWNQSAFSNGESVETTQTVYDSLGTPLTLNVVATLVSRSSAGSTWQFYADSPDGTATGAATQTSVGMGTLSFDTNGNLVNTVNPTVTIDRANTGALPNLAINLDFKGITALAGTSSSLLPGSQDGFPAGVLNKYSIGDDGVIQGFFTNGMTRNVGQVVLATFQNNEGLVNIGNNNYTVGPNSGAAVITTPGALSAGKISAGSLEQSNVDLSSEFVKLIAASTAFSASSRVITSSNQLLQDLLSAAR